MKKFSVLVMVITFCAIYSNVYAQDFLGFLRFGRIEITTSDFETNQAGAIYYDPDGHNPPLFYSPTPVQQKIGHMGIGLNVWYPINFGTPSFDHVAWGFETGINFNDGSQKASVILPEKRTAVNIRIPVLFGPRLKSAVDPYFYGKWGAGISGGFEFIRSSIANETGSFVLPKVQVMISRKKFALVVGYYPLGIKSYYVINGERQARMHTTFFDWSFRFCIPLYSKRYRVPGYFKLLGS